MLKKYKKNHLLNKQNFGLIFKRYTHLILPLIYLVIFASIQNNLIASNVEKIDVSTHKNGESTKANYYYLVDETQKLEFHETLQSGDWLPAVPNVNNRGFTRAVSWMKFTLKNPSEDKLNFILEYVDPAIYSIDLYHRPVGNNSSFQHENFTFNKPVKTRPVAFYRPAFQLSIDSDSESEVYVRIAPGSEILMHSFTSMRIWEENSFYRTTHKELSLLIILLIAELFMGIITAILFLNTRDKLYLYYSIFAFASASLFAAFSGLWSYFIARSGYEIWMVVFQISLGQIAAILFVRCFLETKKHLPTIDKLLVGVICIDLVGVAFNLFGSHDISRIVIDYTAFGYAFFIPIGLLAHKKGVSHALLYTSSWIVFILGMVIASLRLRGYIPDSLFALWLIYFGAFIEIVLLLTIMVLRLLRLKNEKELIELQYRTTLENSASKLAEQVDQKTEQLRQAKLRAENEARIDMLTELTNRRAFYEVAHQYIARAKRNTDTKLYLAIVDIDFFKRINDAHGHAAGDFVLKKIARLLESTLREVDIVSRIGGEEFAIITESDDVDGTIELFERIRLVIEHNSIAIDKAYVSVTISIGLTVFSSNETLDTLMLNADKALYKAKSEGRNRVVFDGYTRDPRITFS